MMAGIIVSEDEKKEILKLNERKNSLAELNVALDEEDSAQNKNLRQRVCDDINEVFVNMNRWWYKIIKKYNMDEGKSYYIRFDENCIYEDLNCDNCSFRN